MTNIQFCRYLWCTGYEIENMLRQGVPMELRVSDDNGIDSWREVTWIYNSALKQMETKKCD